MKFTDFFLATCLTFLSQLVFVDAACPAVPATNALRHKCNVKGSLKRPQAFNDPFESTQLECIDACMSSAECKSFSYDTDSKTCQLYTASLKAQKFKTAADSTTAFWHRRCFTVPSECSTPTVGDDFTATYTYYEATLPVFTPVEAGSQQADVDTTVPFLPSPTPDCILDSLDSGNTFKVVSPDATPLIPVDGQIVLLKAEDVGLSADNPNPDWTPPVYFFQSPEGADDSADGLKQLRVQYGSDAPLYVGYNADTEKVEADEDTTDPDTQYSIFSADCKGAIQITIDGTSYKWFANADGRTTSMAPGSSELGDAILVIPDVAKSQSRRRRDIPYTTGAAPRCPNYPQGLVSRVAPGARGVTTNGCGSGVTQYLVPDFDFGSCCDQHDRCFDDCQNGYFEWCNNDFHNCMSGTCDRNYGEWYKWIAKQGCYALGDLYYKVVAGSSGRSAFYDSNNYDKNKFSFLTGRCQCECTSGSYCNGQCRSYDNDDSNCGSCGYQCSTWASFHCQSGKCVCTADTQNDSNNCGGCGNKCPLGTHCNRGKCACDKGQACGNLCVDLNNHPKNCGSCGNSCGSGYCVSGKCFTPTPPKQDEPPVCYPTSAVKNGGFDDDSASPWVLSNHVYVNSDVGSPNSRPKCLMMGSFYFEEEQSVSQAVTLCPNHDYALDFSVRAGVFERNDPCSLRARVGEWWFDVPVKTTSDNDYGWEGRGQYRVSDNANGRSNLLGPRDSTGTFINSVVEFRLSCPFWWPIVDMEVCIDDVSLYATS